MLLADAILEGMSVNNNNAFDYDASNIVVEDANFFASACSSLYVDIMESDNKFMSEDITSSAICVKGMLEGADRTEYGPVLEGLFKNAIDRIISAFSKFKAKIIEYYHKVIDWFKAMFSGSKKFVTEYGKTLQTKASKVKGFEYNGYPYNVSSGDSTVTSACNEIDRKIKDTLGSYDVIKGTKTKKELYDHLKANHIISNKFDESSKPSASEVVEDFLSSNFSAVKVVDISDLTTELIEVYRGGSSKEIIKDFSSTPVGTMCDFLKTSDDKIKKFESQMKKFESSVNNAVSKLNSFKAEDDSIESQNLISNANYVSSLLTQYLNLYRVPCSVQIQMYKEISKSWLGTLKGFYRYNGKKGVNESTDIAYTMEVTDDEPEEGDNPTPDDSLQEGALGSILAMAQKYC